MQGPHNEVTGYWVNSRHCIVVIFVKKMVTKKALELFGEIAEDREDYKMFYRQHSSDLKLGLIESPINKVKIAELLRFYTSKSRSRAISLKEYVSKMPPDQKDIFFIIGESRQSAASSEFIEPLNKRGYEVLYMNDDFDDQCVVQSIREYDEKLMINCKDIDLDGIEAQRVQHIQQ